MRAKEFINEISRRGFLKGAAAGAVAGAALSPFVLKSPDVKKPDISGRMASGSIVSKNPSTLTNKPLEKYLMTEAIKAGIIGVELAQLMAQCAVESKYFTRLREEGTPKRFKRLYDIMYNPDNAKTLGNTQKGDGERFHGRGFIQLTGRWNYNAASKSIGLDLIKNPDLVLKPDIAAKTTIWFWKFRVQPNVSDFFNTNQVTKPINKSLMHLEERKEWFRKYLETMK